MLNTEKSFIYKISLIMATRMLGLFMILPVFAIFASNYPHSNSFLIGLAIGIYGLTQAILQIPFGYLSDRFGRKPLLIIGLVIFAIGGVISAIGSQNENIHMVIIGRFIAGAGAIASVLMAFVADVVSPTHRSKANAFLGVQIGVAFMLAITLGPLVAEYFNLSGIFYLTSILALFALIMVFFLPASHTHSTYSLSFANIKHILNAKLVSLDISIFLLHFILTAIFLSIPWQLADLNNSLTYGIIFIISFALMIPCIIIAEKNNKHKSILLLAIILLFISQVALYFQFSPMIVAILLIVFFIGFNIVESLTPSIIAKWSDTYAPQKRGLIMSFYSTSQFLGAFSGGIIAGLLHYNMGETAIFVLNSILIVIWFLMIFRRKIWQE
jgi:MFS family permease